MSTTALATKVAIHFQKGQEAIVLALLEEDRNKLEAAVGESSATVMDYAWNPEWPQSITINGKIVTHVISMNQTVAVQR